MGVLKDPPFPRRSQAGRQAQRTLRGEKALWLIVKSRGLLRRAAQANPHREDVGAASFEMGSSPSSSFI